MAFIHGKNAVFKQDASDLSAYCDSIEVKQAADSHDVTNFGSTGHEYLGGLTDGTVSVKGTYDDGTAPTPRLTIQSALGTVVSLTIRSEGTATGKSQTTCSALVTAYEESTPVADMITWTAEYQISGAVVISDQ